MLRSPQRAVISKVMSYAHIFSAAICFAAFSLIHHASAQSVLTNGLVAFYPFEGNANDASGNGNNGTVVGATQTADRFGNLNSAYLFDGISSLISVADSPSLRVTNDITVTCWVNFATNLVEVRIVGKGGDCGRNYGLWLDQGTNWMFQQFPPEGGCIGCQENTVSATPRVIPGRWYQVAGVRVGTISRLYLNGILVHERSPACSAYTYTGSEPLIIGSFDNPVTDSRYQPMQGILDDIRIFNRGLSSDEIVQLYAKESGPRADLIKAVKPSFSNLTIGTNYQLQLSSDLAVWTNHGAPFAATNTDMVYPQYWDVDNWSKLFFRVQISP
jgi:hypothetical protein